MDNNLLQRTFAGNTLEDYLWFGSIVLIGLVLRQFLSRSLTHFVFRFIKKYSAGVGVDRLIILLKEPLNLFILLITFYLAFGKIHFPEEWQLAPVEAFGVRMIISRLYHASLIIAFTWIILRMIDFFGIILSYRASLTESKSDDQLVPFIKESIKIILGIFSFFFMLGTVFHVNVASLIAGLGIGGLAIALAAKESLENLLGSFTIFLDKPFSVGDKVQIGHVVGEVESIGFRSTRIRTLEKSFVTVPNKKMVEAELDNLSLRTQRRVSFPLHIELSTSSEKMKAIVSDIQECLNQHPLVNKEESRAWLHELGPHSLHIMVEYYLNTQNGDVYLNTRQEMNLRIMEIIEKNGSRLSSLPLR